MKSYIAHVSSRIFRALNIESNLARPVINQIPTQSPGRYAAELPLRRIKLFSFQANSPYVPSTHTLWICSGVSPDGNCAYVHWGSFTSNFWSVRRAIWFTWFSEPHECIQHLAVPGGHPSNYEPGATLLDFSDIANTDELTPYSVGLYIRFINVFSKVNLYLEPGVNVYIDLDYLPLKWTAKNNKKCINIWWILIINRPTNVFCTANIVENLFLVTDIITLKPLN